MAGSGPETIAETTYQKLKLALVRGYVSPGTVLTIRNLAKRFGVSVVPVRESLIRLQAQGALELLGNGSVRVPVQSVEEFRDITALRMTLEGDAAAQAASRTDEHGIAELERIQAQFAAAVRSADIQSALDLNEEFHFKLYGMSGSATLVQHIEMLWLRSGPYIAVLFRYFALTGGFVDEGPEGDFGHDRLIEALRHGDPDAARSGILQDVGFTLEQFRRIAARAEASGSWGSPLGLAATNWS